MWSKLFGKPKKKKKEKKNPELLCKAPFAKMFFSTAGYASPCYGSYGFMPKPYGQLSIKEMWESPEWEEVRKKIKEGDLGTYCQYCQDSYSNGKYEDTLAWRYKDLEINESGYPSTMELELSNKCVLECIMCDGAHSHLIREHREKKPPLPEAYDQDFVKQLDEFIPHLRYIEIVGGDPLVYEPNLQIIERVMELNTQCKIRLTVNANTLNNRIRKMLERSNMFEFNISIDSLRKEVYESIRVRGNFEKAMENAQFFIDYCVRHGNYCAILMCPMRMNWREKPDYVRFANKHKIMANYNITTKPAHLALWPLPSKELQEIVDYLSGFDFPAGTWQEKQNKELYHISLSRIEDWLAESKRKEEVQKWIDAIQLPLGLKEEEALFLNSAIHFLHTEYGLKKDALIERGQNFVNKYQDVKAKLDKAVFDKIPISDFFHVQRSIIEQIEEKSTEQLVTELNAYYTNY